MWLLNLFSGGDHLVSLDDHLDLKNDVEFLAEFTTLMKRVDPAGRMVYNEKNEAVFNFGKFKGRLVTEVLRQNPGYYQWMMDCDFPEQTKTALTKIKLSMK